MAPTGDDYGNSHDGSPVHKHQRQPPDSSQHQASSTISSDMSWAPPIPPRPTGWQPSAAVAAVVPTSPVYQSVFPVSFYAPAVVQTQQVQLQATPSSQSSFAQPYGTPQAGYAAGVPWHQYSQPPTPSSTSYYNPHATAASSAFQAPAQAAARLKSSSKLDNTTAKYLWQPPVRSTWNYVLSSRVKFDSTIEQSSIWFIDLFDSTPQDIAELHRRGRKVVAYFSAGSYEDWRPDASKFPKADLGSKLDDWAGERWVRPSSPAVRAIMKARLDLAVQKGFDGIDPDNIDAYDNKNGLKLTKADAIDYVTFLATEARARGLSMGLKNSGDIADKVVDLVQWSVQEQCVQYGDEFLYVTFIKKGKPVFNVEYPKGEDTDNPKQNNNKNVTGSALTKCQGACGLGFSSIIKNIKLDQWIQKC